MSMLRAPMRPPTAAPVAAFEPPTIRHHAPANGARASSLLESTLPLVHFEWLAPRGSAGDPTGREGLAAVAAGLLRDAKRGGGDGESPTQRAETLGSQLEIGVDWDFTFVGFQALASDLEAAYDLLTLLAQPPTVTHQVLTVELRRRVRALAERQRRLASIADDAFARAVYGRHRYGLPLLGTIEGLRRIEVQELHSFFESFASEARVIALGDFDPPRLERWLRRRSWCQGEAHPSAADSSYEPDTGATPGPDTEAHSEAQVFVVDVPGASHAELRYGHRGVARGAVDPRALELLDTILGRSYGSRLNLELRARHGTVYDVRAGFARRRGAGPFVVSTAVATETTSTVLCIIRREIDALRRVPVPATELAAARRFLVGTWPQQFQTFQRLAAQMRRTALSDSSGEWTARQPHRLEALDAATLRRHAEHLLAPERAMTVIAGPARDIATQLRRDGIPHSVTTLQEVKEGSRDRFPDERR
ncbi:MAG: pitrilysin family protein [Acidobacteriota bacterium]